MANDVHAHNPGKKIAEGREAEIFEWHSSGGDSDGDKVLKLFFSESALSARNELEISRTMKAAGVPVPDTFGDLIEYKGRNGIIFERIHGTDLLDQLIAKPWQTGSIGKLLGKLHAELHRMKPVDLPSLKDSLSRQILRARGLTESEKSDVQQILDGLPEGQCTCHGDLHPGNIIMNEDGDPIIIDWANAAGGDPVADFARSELLMSVGWRASNSMMVRSFGYWITKLLLAGYSKTYFAESGVDLSCIDKWRTVVAAARLAEYIPEETDHLLKMVRSGLTRKI
jgi:aminoglycoside phosphotransferase (APT) family kinase protein